MKKIRRFLTCIIFGMIIQTSAISQTLATIDLTSLDLADLMNVEVTLSSRKTEKVSEVANAIYVLTEEDIRRSGYTTLPELFRLIPGLQVGRMDANKWAITVRGFNNFFSNKLLVLVDGRSVYNPIFSGVFWESQNIMLENIDRIEVIRGSGATLWGSNAVNGIVNIVTKDSRDTQGFLTSATLGNLEKGNYRIRYGGRLNEKLTYHLYGKYQRQGNMMSADTIPVFDNWHSQRAGFRLDYHPSKKNHWTLQGEMYDEKLANTFGNSLYDMFQPLQYHSTSNGQHVIAKWQRQMNVKSDLAMQFYFDHFYRDEDFLFSGEYSVLDYDFQYRRSLFNDRHEVVLGAGYRYMIDNMAKGGFVTFDPLKKTYTIMSGFIQDDISLIDEKLSMMVGTKIEQHSQSGFEIQPSLRFLYNPNHAHTLWGSISRAIRIPSRIDFDVISFVYLGSKDIRSEELISFEAGDHFKINKNLYLDFTAFYNQYQGILTYEPIVADNLKDALVMGGELAIDFHPIPGYKLRGGFSALTIDTRPYPESVDIYVTAVEGENPKQQCFLHLFANPNKKIEGDIIFRYVSKLYVPEIFHVPAYFEMDTRVGLTIGQHVTLSLVGRNLLNKSHDEFSHLRFPYKSSLTPRTYYGTLEWTL